jgi:hypothetical protein
MTSTPGGAIPTGTATSTTTASPTASMTYTPPANPLGGHLHDDVDTRRRDPHGHAYKDDDADPHAYINQDAFTRWTSTSSPTRPSPVRYFRPNTEFEPQRPIRQTWDPSALANPFNPYTPSGASSNVLVCRRRRLDDLHCFGERLADLPEVDSRAEWDGRSKSGKVSLRASIIMRSNAPKKVLLKGTLLVQSY